MITSRLQWLKGTTKHTLLVYTLLLDGYIAYWTQWNVMDVTLLLISFGFSSNIRMNNMRVNSEICSPFDLFY